MRKSEMSVPDVVATELTPARAALAHAIDVLDNTQECLAEAQIPLSTLERVRAESIEQVRVLRTEYEACVGVWMEAGAQGDKSAAAAELLPLELRLGGILSGIGGSEAGLSLAREAFAAAADRMRKAQGDRDAALWPAVVEAAGPLVTDLEKAMTAALQVEMRLRSIISALREAGNRDEQNGAFSAASAIEAAISTARRILLPAADTESGRALIDSLRSDPRASF
jgi:hypothetical protein